MNAPNLFQVSVLAELTETMKTKHPEAGWIPCRPYGFPGLYLVRRIKFAWGVFTGKYDAVYWEPMLSQLWKPEDNSDLNALLAEATEVAGGVSIVQGDNSTLSINGTKITTGTKLVTTIPKMVDLSDSFGPVQDQGMIASSSSCAVTAAIAAQSAVKAGIVPFMYYNERDNDDRNPYWHD